MWQVAKRYGLIHILLALNLLFSWHIFANSQEQRVKKQDEILKELAFAGHLKAQDEYLKRLLAKLNKNPHINTDELQFFLEWAALRGKPNATYRLGYLYLIKPHLSNEIGIELIARAALLGNEKAMSDFNLLPGIIKLNETKYISAFERAYKTLSLKQPIDCQGWNLDCEKVSQKVDFSENSFFSAYHYQEVNSIADISLSFTRTINKHDFDFNNAKASYLKIVEKTNKMKRSNPVLVKSDTQNTETQQKALRHKALKTASSKLSVNQKADLLDENKEQLLDLLDKFNRHRLPVHRVNLEQLMKMINEETDNAK